MSVGPIQLVVLGFSKPDFRGEIMAELERLRQNDTVRVIDSLATVYRSLPLDPRDDDSTPAAAALDPDGPRWGRLLRPTMSNNARYLRHCGASLNPLA